MLMLLSVQMSIYRVTIRGRWKCETWNCGTWKCGTMLQGGGKCETWKCEKRDSMEHRVLHMSVHCRAGMHESTRAPDLAAKLCCQLCCQLCCTDYIFIIRFYSSYICHLKYLITTTGRTLRLHLKIDFDTDLASNITRHCCTISAELVVSSSSIILSD